MPSCAVSSCKNTIKNTKGRNVSFFRFPRDPNVRKAWLTACRRADTFNQDNAVLCSEHFASEEIEGNLQRELLGIPFKRSLVPGSVPTLNLPSDVTNKETSTNSPARGERRYKRNVRKRAIERLKSLSPVSKRANTSNDVSSSDIILKKRKPVVKAAHPQIKSTNSEPVCSQLSTITPNITSLQTQITRKLTSCNVVTPVSLFVNTAVNVDKTPSDKGAVGANTLVNRSPATEKPALIKDVNACSLLNKSISTNANNTVCKQLITSVPNTVNSQANQKQALMVVNSVTPANLQALNSVSSSLCTDVNVTPTNTENGQMNYKRAINLVNSVTTANIRGRQINYKQAIEKLKAKSTVNKRANSSTPQPDNEASPAKTTSPPPTNLKQKLSELEESYNALQSKYSALEATHRRCGAQINVLEWRVESMTTQNERLKAKLKETTTLVQSQSKMVNEKVDQLLGGIFSPSQIRWLTTKQKKGRWQKEDILKALELLSLGRDSYMYVRTRLGVPLPGLSTLKRWTTDNDEQNHSPPDMMYSICDVDVDEEVVE